eukprot:TRINITY_DN12335_c0_g2_i3.p1 TRINITY_DN12335_c0_g2~~TRINITY_DN12335_c0_g2_i3.p1  ORF type:complete len:358 (+),score=70.58 TRINITY_DN12335_c0_g2_i3:118-1191(+)
MPTFPCHECDGTFKNMVQLRNHRLSGQCEGMEKAIKEAHEAASRVVPKYEFDFFNEGVPAKTLNGAVWLEPGFEGGHHSAGGLGSLGVRFLNLKADRGVVVLKQGDLSTATEYFCSLVLCHLGIRCPRIRVLTNDEWRQAASAAAQVPFTEAGAGARLAEERTLSSGGVLQSFQPGFTLKDPRVKGLLTGKNGSDYLAAIGELAATDMLLNNFDRTPTIWDHEGNANNIMFSTAGVAAIDNATTGIKNEDGIARYTARVKAVVAEAKAQDHNGHHTQKLCTYISRWIERPLESTEIDALQRGMLDQARKIADYTQLARAWEEAFSTFSGASWGQSGMDVINLPFIQAVQQAFQEAVA